MLDGTCAYCANRVHFTAHFGRVVEAPDQPDNDMGQQLLRVELATTCDNCGRMNCVLGDARIQRGHYSAGSDIDGRAAKSIGGSMTNLSFAPPLLQPAVTEFLPGGVAGYLTEAHHASSIGAYRAVLLLVRSTIEATAKSKGVRSGSLFDKIDAMADQGMIRSGTKEMAHLLRVLGNDMAHGDIDEVPSQEDAEDALTVLRFVLDDVFVADARRADMYARRRPASVNPADA
ncbi:hypothetical protein GCM10011490_24100 [Pseudoclavibacter endophyticus]|uniref:DUF4145 domain-containing protein n=1 Tax=Pseudoclavibacter endophyticus TaxID=1778590 RepID=A0A6H9WCJ4_9MICO|nr:DUF4145 domain-containing protein [Pseudoclavibacter endophyticus]KAB1648413.1 DUF4145 domain-containing protein [Pseudoclavibacter endophyticus]GGA72509.1 hypothetical protein GCM10011490_24100 [Pseudoclavibacter endophyticus]